MLRAEEWLVRRLQVATTKSSARVDPNEELRWLGSFSCVRGLAGTSLGTKRRTAIVAYNADIKESSISGTRRAPLWPSSFGVSWSSIIKGVGVIAGGPFYCAQARP